MNIINIRSCAGAVLIGQRGENEVTQVKFDYSTWIEQFGNGTIQLYVLRKGDANAYPVVVETADGVATWTVTNIDTAVAGYGKAEFVFLVDEKVAKSAVFGIYVEKDIGESSDTPPDPYESWLDTLTALGAETRQNAQNAAQSASDAEQSATGAAASAQTAQDTADSIHGMTVEAETLAPGSSATAVWNGTDERLKLGIPRGDKGDTGATPNLTIGAVTTLTPDEDATATITGTPENPILNLGLPQGKTGEVTAEMIWPYLPTDSASGAVASFTDGADDIPVKSLVVNIEPVQGGSGDPSPENVRPISGWTGVYIYHSGADTSAPDTYSIAFPSEAGTVYGGTLDVTTGVLTVDWIKVDADSVSFGLHGSGNYFYSTSGSVFNKNKKTGLGNVICDIYKTDPTSNLTSGDNLIRGRATDGSVFVRDTSCATAADLKTALTGHVFVYELANPITYQLTPTEVKTLLGANSIWADTGDVEVTYRADTKLYIDKRIAEVTA